METVPRLIEIFTADSALRKLCGKRFHQNQAPADYFDCEALEAAGGYPAFVVITRRSVVREDVLRKEDRNPDPDEEALDVDVATGDPESTEKIAARIVALLDGKDDLVFGGRTAQFVETTDQDEGYTPREELIALGYDVASMRIGIYY